MKVFLNGAIIPEEDATVSVDDRGLLFGDGVFETGLLLDGGFFRLRLHLERLAASADMLRLPLPPIDEIDAIIRDVVRANGLRDAGIRVTFTRGAARPTLLVTARPRDAAASARDGWRIITATTRRPSTAAVPAQLKALGRTYALLARHEAAAAGADDALLLTDAGDVCEGPTWNVFWRTGDLLETPALDVGVLAGVTRSAILELARAQGLATRQVVAPRDRLDAADEIFATMTSLGIVPIRALDDRRMPATTPVADVLQPAYWQLVAREAAEDPL